MLLLLISMLTASAAETLVAWSPLRVTLGNTNIQTLVNVPESCRYIQLRPETSDAYLSTTEAGDCTDAATKDATDYWILPADSLTEIRVPGSKSGRSRKDGGTTFCVSGSGNAIVIGLMCTSDHD